MAPEGLSGGCAGEELVGRVRRMVNQLKTRFYNKIVIESDCAFVCHIYPSFLVVLGRSDALKSAADGQSSGSWVLHVCRSRRESPGAANVY